MPNDKSGFDQGEYDQPEKSAQDHYKRPERPLEYETVPAGTRPAQCRASHCGAVIYWIEREPQQKTPHKIVKVPIDCDHNEQCVAPTADEDGVGVNHFQTCTEANQF
jgi:hypothetical protein